MIRMRPGTLRTLDGIVVGILLLLAVLLMGVNAAHSAELVPALGLSRSSSDGTTRAFGSVAFRPSLLPLVKPEIAIAHRSEPRLDGDLTMSMWPVTASLWVSPVPSFYVGGGFGWYHTTYNYRDDLGIPNHTSQEFAPHVGGGMTFPLIPAVVTLDIGARYVHLKDEASPIAPGGIPRSFVSAAVGVAIKI
jgi:hypothetical protein